MRFDASSRHWSLAFDDIDGLPDQTMPLDPEAALPLDAPSILPSGHSGLMGQLRFGLATIACMAAIGALVALNASFAWGLGGGEPLLQWAFVLGLMAMDLIRPLLVTMGFALIDKAKGIVASVCFVIALGLSPVSILSSSSILSATIQLGQSINQRRDEDQQIRAGLHEAFRQQLYLSEQQRKAWEAECSLGGCGPKADKLLQQALATQKEATSSIKGLKQRADKVDHDPALIPRLIASFEAMGLLREGRELLLPLFLAISLELAALFGPALLLRR